MSTQETEISPVELAFEQSTIPLLIVSRTDHQVLQANAQGKELLNSSDAEWWNRLDLVHEESKELLEEEIRSQFHRTVEQISLVMNCGLQGSFRLTVADLGENYLLTFLPLEPNRVDTTLMEETFRGTELRAGESYFHHCAEAFCKSFGMDCSIIARLDEGSAESSGEMVARTVSYFHSEEGFMSPITYPLLDTPCWLPYNTGEPHCIPCSVQSLFPLDLDLVKMNIESYLGVPILDEDGKVFGHLALLSSKPISEPTQMERMFLKIFAARSGAEFRRSDTEKQLRAEKLKAEEANRAKTMFLANMSHELRSPLNAVLGFAQLLKENEILDPESQLQAENIYRNGRHLLSLINDLLDMSRIELGQVEVFQEAVVLADIHQDIRAMFSFNTSEEFQFEVEIASDLPAIIRTDHSKVRQILTNLISNALKYAGQGTVTYRVEKKEEPSEKKAQLIFSIIDQGQGISPKLQESIFDPFDRGSFSEFSEFNGTGLGLSIARRFARAMGGEVGIESELGQGSTFTLTLPYDTQASSEQIPQNDSPERTLPHHQGTILAVDDNEASREIVRKVLERAGHRVIEAEDGLKGFEACLRERPDLVLMDVRMPNMSGLEAAHEIRGTLQSESPPIIGLTGDMLDVKGTPRDHEVFDLVIGKPFEFQILTGSVARMLSQRT